MKQKEEEKGKIIKSKEDLIHSQKETIEKLSI